MHKPYTPTNEELAEMEREINGGMHAVAYLLVALFIALVAIVVAVPMVLA